MKASKNPLPPTLSLGVLSNGLLDGGVVPTTVDFFDEDPPPGAQSSGRFDHSLTAVVDATTGDGTIESPAVRPLHGQAGACSASL